MGVSMKDEFKASDLRSHGAEIIDRAVNGEPVFISRRDGARVVVIDAVEFEREREARMDALFDKIIQRHPGVLEALADK